ncbi:MAG: hypothetical protein QOE23_2639 [Pseudonocardiales bacterium]|jgi:hypothetical protein|nr:hypothetical protein [Pseudonocardiales bacterium]
MPRESARSLRAGVLGVGALGALLLSVPASLWLGSGSVYPVLRPVDSSAPAVAFDADGRLLTSPARLRSGSSAVVVASGFRAGEVIRVRRSAAEGVVGSRADQHGVVRYRFTVPATPRTQSLAVIGSLDQAGLPHRAVFRFVVSSDQAGR